MLHNITLTKEQFGKIENVLVTEDAGNFEKLDTVVLTCEGTRDQTVKYIGGNYIEKVHKGWCYLFLTDTRGEDDLPARNPGDESHD